VKTTMDASARRSRARARGRQHRLAGGTRRRLRRPAAAALEAAHDRRARLRPRRPVHRRGRGAARAIAHHAAVALEHGRAVMRGVLAQEIHHRVKNNLQTSPPCCGCRRVRRASTRARRSTTRSIASSRSPRCTSADGAARGGDRAGQAARPAPGDARPGLAAASGSRPSWSRCRSPDRGRRRWRSSSASCSRTPSSTEATR